MSFAAKFKQASGSQLSAKEKVLFERSVVYVLTQPVGELTAHYVFRVSDKEREAFEEVTSRETFDIQLEDYGTILYAGWLEPTFEEKKEFHRLYGIYAADVAN